MRTYNICFVGLYDEKNYGDPIIGDCTEWLIERTFNEDTINKKRICLDSPLQSRSHCIIQKVLQKFHKSSKSQLFGENDCCQYFYRKIKGCDIIVLVGGGLLKYSNVQSFSSSISGLLKAADSLTIPVIFNSVGVEGYDEYDVRCQKLKDAIHRTCVKFISTRDDITTLRNFYFDGCPTIPCCLVCDPAVWVSDVYAIKKDEKSNAVGLGIIRGEIFIDYGIQYTEEELLDMYVSIYICLKSEGRQVCLFTNGLDSDNQFAGKVKRKLEEHFGKVILFIPKSPRDLVCIIAKFKSIVAARLHALIIAYSLDIPAVGLVWNDKLKFFRDNINANDYFLDSKDFNSTRVIEKLHQSEHKKYDEVRRKDFKRTIIDSMITIKNQIIYK